MKNEEKFATLVAVARAQRPALLEKVKAMSREEIIELLVWNDPNGIWSDGDLAANDLPAMTHEQAMETLVEHVTACVD